MNEIIPPRVSRASAAEGEIARLRAQLHVLKQPRGGGSAPPADQHSSASANARHELWHAARSAGGSAAWNQTLQIPKDDANEALKVELWQKQRAGGDEAGGRRGQLLKEQMEMSKIIK